VKKSLTYFQNWNIITVRNFLKINIRRKKTMKKNSNTLAVKMSIALVLGIIAGFLCIFFRERVGVDSGAWKFLNFLLFQDISAKGGERAIGIFYIIGQLFINSLQLVIIPMVYTSITLAICHISDTRKLGRIS
jgi:L-cystine uptake protein TcyP (sodium:dicarboxylate symporter family)